jgi:hypothetical protein
MTTYQTGAYCWRNIVNRKVYVGGASVSFPDRERGHRRLLAAGTSARMVASYWGLSLKYVRAIVDGTTWKHVPRPARGEGGSRYRRPAEEADATDRCKFGGGVLEYAVVAERSDPRTRDCQ